MSEPAFLPTHALVTAQDATPTRWMFVLHGILGSGTNFRSFARRLASACPTWGFILVDIRMHGQSQDAPPPHTVANAAEDLGRLEAKLALPVAGVLGHSFGGKVALAYAARHSGELEQVWVLDASPSARERAEQRTNARDVLRVLEAMPWPLPSRERFFELAAEQGLSKAIAEWLAMNVRRADDGFRLRLDLDAIKALLDDYFAIDLWPILEQPGTAREMHVVIAGRSDALDDDDRARLAALAPRVRAHVIEDAGHWVHVDAPDALFDLLRDALSR